MSSLGEFEGMTAEDAIAEAARRYSNHGKWGPDDQLGCANYITPEKVREAAALVKRGAVFSLALPFDHRGPQAGAAGRFNPIHLMSFTGADYLATDESRRAPHGFGGTDDIVIMPLQCGTQWDALSHIFDHGVMWNGYSCAEVNSRGARKCGIEHAADKLTTRGVLLDVPRAKGLSRLDDGYAITPDDLDATIEAQGATAEVHTGDIVIVRTGHLGDARTSGWGGYAGGDAPGLSFSTLGWLHSAEIAGVATDTWGAEVRPLEFPGSYQPFHQVAIPHIGLMLGEIWQLDALAEDCASDGVYEFQLIAQPLPFTGGVGSPVNPIAIK